VQRNAGRYTRQGDSLHNQVDQPDAGHRPSLVLERELVVAAEGGDTAARERLVNAFLPTIGGVARMYRNSSAVNRGELMQEGVVGLLRALDRYDPDVGAPFWAYASWWVRQAMQQLVSEMTRPVVLSDRALRRLARLKEARREHIQAEGHEPGVSDLVAATDFTRAQVDSLLAVERTPRGLEETLMGEEGSTATLGDLVADPKSEDEYERVVDNMETAELTDLTDSLAEREREIVCSHYGFGRPAKTLRQIAEGLDLSVERVRQLEERALGKLREAASWPAHHQA
jgi:RNA polymerase primary sigma factor